MIAAGLSLLTACAGHGGLRIDCGATDVIMDADTASAIKASSGEANFATDVCAVANKIDSSSYSDPQSVNVTMPSGNEYDVKLQASQN
jgi:hypothetical protein